MGGVHGTNLTRLDGVAVTAICDQSFEAASGLKAKLGIECALYDDFEALLERGRMDALYVCLPPFAHSGQVERAIGAGLHVFVEKPIALSVAAGEGMVRAAEETGVVTQVGFHQRFGYAVERLRELVEAGEAGRATLLQARFFCNSLHSPWWRDRARSGGQVVEQIIHQYDAARHLMGPVRSVRALTANLCHGHVTGYSVEDTSVSLLEFENGALGTIAGSNCATPGRWASDMRVVYEKVTADFTSPNDARFLYPTGEFEAEEEGVEDADDMYFKETVDFIESVRKGTPASVPLTEGLESLKLVLAVAESAEKQGESVTL
jgi:predicted dehydrogenase